MDDSPEDYETSEEWSDVIPIPQNEGGPKPLAAIAYTEEYSTAMSYLRAVMSANEYSPRILKLTEHIIKMNPAHYTVWLYRAETIKALSVDPLGELSWVNKITQRHAKNYQIWHHRQVIMSMIASIPPTELPFLARMLAKDSKNYHVWSYRQWLVRHFSLWPTSDGSSSELAFTASLLSSDVRNNSAWNHRYFVLFGQEDRSALASFGNINNNKEDRSLLLNETQEKNIQREIEFTKARISEAPQNTAAWNYLRGVLRLRGNNAERDLIDFATAYADLENPDDIRSSHALEFLAAMWAEKADEAGKAKKALELLSQKFDPIRKGYWEYRIEHLPPNVPSA